MTIFNWQVHPTQKYEDNQCLACVFHCKFICIFYTFTLKMKKLSTLIVVFFTQFVYLGSLLLLFHNSLNCTCCMFYISFYQVFPIHLLMGNRIISVLKRMLIQLLVHFLNKCLHRPWILCFSEKFTEVKWLHLR